MASDTHHEARGAHAGSDAAAGGSDYASFRVLTEHDRRAVIGIIESKLRVKLAQAQVREDVKAIAERLEMKSSELNRIMKLAMQEQERGNVLALEKALIEVAEQIAAG